MQKIEELDSIRGLAALLIVIYHIPLWNSGLNFGIVRNGYLMVDLFFVLSGFVIYSAYSENISNSKHLLKFQFLRFGRLYPVHILFLAVFVLIEIAKYIAQQRMGIVSPNSQPFRENNIMAFVEHLFLVQAIGPTGNATTFNGPSWSISVEFYTYLVFGLVALYASKLKNYIFAAIFCIAFALLLTENTFGFERVLSCYSGFFLGCLVANAKQKTGNVTPSFCAPLMLAALIVYLSVKPIKEYDSVITFISALFIFSLVTSKGFLNRVLTIKPLAWLGSISYSLYMSHVAIIWVANQIFRVALKRPEAVIEGSSIPTLSFHESVIAYALVLAAIIAISSIVYTFIEKPFRSFSRIVASDVFESDKKVSRGGVAIHQN